MAERLEPFRNEETGRYVPAISTKRKEIVQTYMDILDDVSLNVLHSAFKKAIMEAQKIDI